MLKSLTSLFGLGVDGETVDQRKDRELKELSEKRLYEWEHLVACVEEYCYKEKKGCKVARYATTIEGERVSIYGGFRRCIQCECCVDSNGMLKAAPSR